MTNNYKIIGDSVIIDLTRGYTTKISIEDLEFLLSLDTSWYTLLNKGKCYACAKEKGTRKTLRMHRYLCRLSSGDDRIVDHKNGDGLDNTRGNMRVCTEVDNHKNISKYKNNTSGYRNIYKRSKSTWVAEIQISGKLYHKRFTSPIEATRYINRLRVDNNLQVDRKPIHL